MNGGLIQQSNVFPGLSEGGYIVTVVDSDNCTASEIVEIGVNNDLLMSITSENSGCGSSVGSITITASGGEALEYSINEGAFQQSNTFQNLSGGEYIVVTRDGKGCTLQDTVRVLNGTSYEFEVAPIINTNCAVSGCHDGSGATDWTNFENVQNNADNIALRTENRTMPPGGSGYELTDEQFDYLASNEPPNMYPADVHLQDGEIATAFLYPEELIKKNNYPDISDLGGWANYKASLAV